MQSARHSATSYSPRCMRKSSLCWFHWRAPGVSIARVEKSRRRSIEGWNQVEEEHKALALREVFLIRAFDSPGSWALGKRSRADYSNSTSHAFHDNIMNSGRPGHPVHYTRERTANSVPAGRRESGDNDGIPILHLPFFEANTLTYLVYSVDACQWRCSSFCL